MLRLRAFDGDFAMIPSWLPLAVAAGSLGYAVYVALLVRTVRKQPVSAENRTDACLVWPCHTDRRYFDSELQLALSYLQLARSTRVGQDAADCRSRALEIYTDLSSWMACHGGDAAFDRELNRLRWLIEAQETPQALDF